LVRSNSYSEWESAEFPVASYDSGERLWV